MTKHFLFVMWDGGGTVPPELGVARRLIGRGHRVTVLADDSIEDEARSVGAGFVGYRNAPNRRSRRVEDDPLQDWEVDPMEGITRMVHRIMCDPALGIARDVLDVHAQDPVDCVAACSFRPGAIMGAERAGVPCVVLCPNIDLREAPGQPGLGPGLHPLEGPEGEARDAGIWKACRDMFASGQPPLDYARRELGLEPTAHPWDEYDRAERVLLLTSRHFEYPYHLPPRTMFAGPVLEDPTWTRPDGFARTGPGRPLVLVSLGSSFQNQLGLYRRIVAALAEIEVDAVVTLGEVFDPAEIDAPPNVTVVSSAPHAPLLARASAIVSHCGHGSVMKALAAGVPMICLPIARDQTENAARVEWHGAGIRLDAVASVEEIRCAVERLLQDQSFSSKARELSVKIKGEVAENIAVRELEQVAGATVRPGIAFA